MKGKVQIWWLLEHRYFYKYRFQQIQLFPDLLVSSVQLGKGKFNTTNYQDLVRGIQ